jgi:hypothetical protein
MQRGLSRWTLAWLLACVVCVAHIADEVYNGSYGFYSDLVSILAFVSPAIQLAPFQFDVWLLNISGAMIVMFALTPLVHIQRPIMVLASYVFALMLTANATMHIAFSLSANKALAGIQTAPLLLIAGLFLFTSIPSKLENSIAKTA